MQRGDRSGCPEGPSTSPRAGPLPHAAPPGLVSAPGSCSVELQAALGSRRGGDLGGCHENQLLQPAALPIPPAPGLAPLGESHRGPAHPPGLPVLALGLLRPCPRAHGVTVLRPASTPSGLPGVWETLRCPGRGVPIQAPRPRDSGVDRELRRRAGSLGGIRWGHHTRLREGGHSDRCARQAGRGRAPLGPWSEEATEAVTRSPGLGSAGWGAGGQHAQDPALFRGGSQREQGGTHRALGWEPAAGRSLDREPPGCPHLPGAPPRPQLP